MKEKLVELRALLAQIGDTQINNEQTVKVTAQYNIDASLNVGVVIRKSYYLGGMEE